MEDKKLNSNGKVNTVPSAHKQADQDIHTDVDLSEKGPEDELDEGELARFESEDDGEMDISDQDSESI